MRRRPQVINALRAHLAELGIAAAQGTAGLKELLKIIASDAGTFTTPCGVMKRVPAWKRKSSVLMEEASLFGAHENLHSGRELSTKRSKFSRLAVVVDASSLWIPTTF